MTMTPIFGIQLLFSFINAVCFGFSMLHTQSRAEDWFVNMYRLDLAGMCITGAEFWTLYTTNSPVRFTWI